MECNRDCFNCKFEDCQLDNAKDDISDELDIYANKQRGTYRQYRYNHSDKGKASRQRYEKSNKGKATRNAEYKKRLDLEWLCRYDSLYRGNKRNTNKRRCKAYRIRQKYGIEV